MRDVSVYRTLRTALAAHTQLHTSMRLEAKGVILSLYGGFESSGFPARFSERILSGVDAMNPRTSETNCHFLPQK